MAAAHRATAVRRAAAAGLVRPGGRQPHRGSARRCRPASESRAASNFAAIGPRGVKRGETRLTGPNRPNCRAQEAPGSTIKGSVMGQHGEKEAATWKLACPLHGRTCPSERRPDRQDWLGLRSQASHAVTGPGLWSRSSGDSPRDRTTLGSDTGRCGTI
jgi:hypothetical protein